VSAVSGLLHSSKMSVWHRLVHARPCGEWLVGETSCLLTYMRSKQQHDIDNNMYMYIQHWSNEATQAVRERCAGAPRWYQWLRRALAVPAVAVPLPGACALRVPTRLSAPRGDGVCTS